MKTWRAAASLVLIAALPAALLAQSAANPVPALSDEAIAAMPLNQRFSTLLMRGRYLASRSRPPNPPA